MSLECVQNYLRDQLGNLMSELSNGSCRFLELADPTATDAQGFPETEHKARTVGFIKCVWRERPVKEQEIALQARGVNVFEIQVPILFDNTPVVAEENDRIELTANFTGTVETIQLEIVGLSTPGTSYVVLAMRIPE